jgi:hypothetical protein
MHIQFKVSVAHAFDLFDVVSNLLKHASYLAVLAFNQSNFVPGIVGFTDQVHSGGRGFHSSSIFCADE